MASKKTGSEPEAAQAAVAEGAPQKPKARPKAKAKRRAKPKGRVVASAPPERQKGPGQPTKLTPALQAEVVELVEAGNLNDTAAVASGIDRATFYNWMRWGQHGKQQGKRNAYVQFFDAITRARAKAEVDLLAEARGGDEVGLSNGKAKCAQWTLERTRGLKFAPRVQVKVEEMAEALLEDVHDVCAGKSCGCYEAIVERVARRARGEEADGIAGDGGPEAAVH